ICEIRVDDDLMREHRFVLFCGRQPKSWIVNYFAAYHRDRQLAVSGCLSPRCRTAGTNSYPLSEQPGPAKDSRTTGTRSSNPTATR
ncbi:MAG TPA: hypothetical protein VHQ94_23030, partial [Pyrinomonadaceae bacterium]|nr:hypothetical protein [Pyrinomonadaceae bacterium]